MELKSKSVRGIRADDRFRFVRECLIFFLLAVLVAKSGGESRGGFIVNLNLTFLTGRGCTDAVTEPGMPEKVKAGGDHP